MRTLSTSEVMIVSGAGGKPLPTPEEARDIIRQKEAEAGMGGVDPFFEVAGDAMQSPFSTIGRLMDNVVRGAYNQGVVDDKNGDCCGVDLPDDFYDTPDGHTIQPYQ